MTEIANIIHRDKYAFGNETWVDTCHRLAKSVGMQDDQKLIGHLINKEFIPGGRMIANLGTGRTTTEMNCYVSPVIEDSMEGIYGALGVAAKTQQMGGGIGMDFGSLRPGADPKNGIKPAVVRGVGAVASGPLTFMDSWDSMCRTVMSAGCLAGETNVTTDIGFVPIKRIVDERLPVKVKTHKGWRNIKEYFDNGEKETVEVFFENGRSIVCTPEHRFHTIDDNGAVVKRPIKEMGVGDTALFATIPTALNNASVPPDLSYLLGHYWANGCTNYRSDKLHYVHIAFADSETGLITRGKCEEILRSNEFEFNLRPGCGKCTIVMIYGDHARRLVDLAGVKGYSTDITFPEGVDVIPFIAGYFDGDGTWKSAKKGPTFTSTSSKMLHQVQDHLFNLGVPSKIHSEERKNDNWHIMHSLSIPSPHWQVKFRELLSPWLTKIADVPPHKGHAFVYPKSVLKSVDFKPRDIRGRISGTRNISYHTFSDIFPNAAILEFGGIRIKRIEPRGVMRVYDIEVDDTHSYVAENISVSNSRRGAMMATMSCNHPNIEAFVEAKGTSELIDQVADEGMRAKLYQQYGRFRMFNVSVLITDDFMSAVHQDLDWNLVFKVPFEGCGDPLPDGNYVYKTLKARALWDKIMRHTYEFSEPGVIFIDRVNNLNNLKFCENIQSTNPCGEQPLPPNGNCCLVTVNLAKMIDKPFTPYARINIEALKSVVEYAVTFADRVIDVAHYPTEAMRVESHNKRRIGVGIMGLGTALQMMNIKYGSKLAIRFTDEIMKYMARYAYTKSIRLAETLGSFPLYDEQWNYNAILRRLQTEFPDDSAFHNVTGVRNGVILNIAPTGTTAMLADNVTSGIEPPFFWDAKRKILQEDGSYREFLVKDYGYSQVKGSMPESFVTINEITPEDQVKMQAAAQNWVDASISKTVSVPAGTSFDDFKSVYMTAYELGCKGCTTYTPSIVRGSVVSDAKSENPKSQKSESPKASKLEKPMKRPYALDSKTYKLEWPHDEAATYVTVSNQDGKMREVFVSSKFLPHYEWVSAITRLLSAMLANNIDPKFLIEELKQIHDHSAGGRIVVNGKSQWAASRPAALAAVLEAHMAGIASEPAEVESAQSSWRWCPACGAPAFVREAGCWHCKECDHSSCE